MKKILNDIKHGKNLDVYLTIALAIAIGCLHILHIVKFEIAAGAILVTLALLAVTMLKVRRTSESVIQALSRVDDLRNEIRQTLKPPAPSISELFHNRDKEPALRVQLEDAQTIDICAMSLLTVVTRHREVLLEKIKSGCRIRLILLNPKNDALMQMVSRFVSDMNVDTHIAAIATSLQALTVPPFNAPPCEVRIYDYPLGHGLLIANSNADKARVRVELLMGKGMPANAPAFYVYKQQDPHLFEVFKNEFETLWEMATPVRSDAKGLIPQPK